MNHLLYKEFRLAAHPTLYIFLWMGALILIPSYPYTTVFIFGCFAPLITLQNGRENHDAFYTATLPVKKSQVVKGKFFLFITTQIAQLLLTLPFTFIRITQIPLKNTVGMAPNLTYYAAGLLIFTLFNFFFFTEFYKTAHKIGKAFIKGMVPAFLVALLTEIASHIPQIAWLNSLNKTDLRLQLPIFLFAVIFFIAGNLLAFKIAKERFEKVDL